MEIKRTQILYAVVWLIQDIKITASSENYVVFFIFFLVRDVDKLTKLCNPVDKYIVHVQNVDANTCSTHFT